MCLRELPRVKLVRLFVEEFARGNFLDQIVKMLEMGLHFHQELGAQLLREYIEEVE